MENTLDSIYPPNDPQEEMSYLFGRDPSILAYSQRPLPSKDTKKNLLSLYEIEENISVSETGSTHSDTHSSQTVKVYLRLKPVPKKLKLTEEQQEAYKIINSATLITRLPMLDNNMSSFKQSRSNDIVCRKFTFSHTFGPETTQLELFEQIVQQQMIDFLAGHNCTIMAYGTTNSGKSYTLQGTTTSPGLIPRALEFVFSNVITRPSPPYKPLHLCNVVSLNALERAQELEAKTKLLTFSSIDKHQYINTYKQMQKLLQEESVRPSQSHDAHYSIWVSFAEIYNEIVYDLLSNECQKKRIPLKLGTDSHGRAFIKGLKTVYVNSAAEAYQVLMAGQYNLKVAATALNAKSSRSHCIFTITLLKYYSENLPDSVEVSMFSFCDLAGSERLKKTLNIGDRLKEAQNINTSLLVLGRCLKSIHEGQLMRSRADAIGPFRESKLTRLFQHALSGKEHLSLIVNVNPLPNLYIETQNVLNFAAIAKRIVIEEKKKIQKKLKSRFSQIVSQSIETVTDWDTVELESVDWQRADIVENVSEYVTSEEYRDLVNENERLKKEIALAKTSAMMRDIQSRKEMAQKYIAMMKELEIDWKQRMNDVEIQHEDTLEWTIKQVEEFYRGKINQLHREKIKHTCCNDDNDEHNDHLKLKIEEIEKENIQLKTKNDSLTKTVTELKVTNESLITEKSKVSFEVSLLKEDLKTARNLLEAAQKDVCLNEDGKVYTKEMTSQLLIKDEQVKRLKEFLNEAKEEYIIITTDLRQKELCLNDQTKIIIENAEKIEDLESHIEQINACLTEKTRIVELLEEKLECQTDKLSNTENNLLELEEEIKKLKDEQSLFRSYKKLTISPVSVVYNSQYNTKCFEGQEVQIKEELVADNKLENSNNVRENTEEEIQNIVKNDPDIKNLSRTEKVADEADIVNKLKSALFKDALKQNSEQAMQILQSNMAESDINCTKMGCIKSLGTLVDTSCQVDIENDKNDIKNDLDKDISYDNTQITTKIMTKEENQINNNKISSKEDVIQTTEVLEDDLIQLKELTMQYNNVQIQYEQQCLNVKKLTEELCNMKMTMQSLEEENNSKKIILDKYKHSMEILRQELLSTTEEKREMQETLLNSGTVHEKKITSYEQKIEQLEKNLSNMKEDIDNCTLNCKQEKDLTTCKSDELKENIFRVKEENNVSNVSIRQLDEHVDEIVLSKRNLESMTQLQHDIIKLNKSLETCKIEKDSVQKALDENNKKLLELKNLLEQTTLKEQEKDAEIATLQKEVKHMIQKNENIDKTDDMMEVELKSTINELTQMKEALSQKEQYIKELKIHKENFERNAKIFNLLEGNAKERQVENERLRNVNDELRTTLVQKEHEMDSFMKNRDETVTKYEVLVKNQQEELDRQKREVMRYQELFRRQITPTPNKDECKRLQNRIEVLQDRLQKYEGSAKSKDYYDTSEDEVLAQRKSKRRGRKVVLSVKQENIPVIELSGSESKRNPRHIALPVPPLESSPEKRRTTRKKKLFVANDSFADIEPSENIIPPTPLATRNLRNRKK